MTATAVPASAYRALRPANFGDVLRSEWTKFRSVRSSFWSLLVAAVLAIGLGALITYLRGRHYATDPGSHIHWDPTSVSLTAFALAQLAIGVLGVMVITSEYSTGMIRTSLAAVPKRGRVVAAKAIVFTTVALISGLIMSFIAFGIGQAILKGQAPSTSLGDQDVLRAVIGAGMYLAALGLLGLAVGTVLRHAAAAISTLVAILFVLPGIANALPTSWQQPIEKYWPTNAGQSIAAVTRDSNTMTSWAGFGVMCLFVAVVLALAFVVLERKDA
ncbi:MAG: ABC transporter permease [Acidimicrobiaceae bacterium]|nr:ABC transporter permease [Acidimicrobiaceae bacterium]